MTRPSIIWLEKFDQNENVLCTEGFAEIPDSEDLRPIAYVQKCNPITDKHSYNDYYGCLIPSGTHIFCDTELQTMRSLNVLWKIWLIENNLGRQECTNEERDELKKLRKSWFL